MGVKYVLKFENFQPGNKKYPYNYILKESVGVRRLLRRVVNRVYSNVVDDMLATVETSTRKNEKGVREHNSYMAQNTRTYVTENARRVPIASITSYGKKAVTWEANHGHLKSAIIRSRVRD